MIREVRTGILLLIASLIASFLLLWAKLHEELLFIIPAILAVIAGSYIREGFSETFADGYRAGEYIFRYATLLSAGIIVLQEGSSSYIVYISGIIILVSALLFLFFGMLFLGAAVRQVGKMSNEPLSKIAGNLIEATLLFAVFDLGLMLVIPSFRYYLFFAPLLVLLSLVLAYIGLKRVKEGKMILHQEKQSLS